MTSKLGEGGLSSSNDLVACNRSAGSSAQLECVSHALSALSVSRSAKNNHAFILHLYLQPETEEQSHLLPPLGEVQLAAGAGVDPVELV